MQASTIAPRDRLIVALDLPDVAAAEAMITRLGDSVTFYKIGYQLAYAGGLPLVRQLADGGKKVFIDLNLHDIGTTGARGGGSLAGDRRSSDEPGHPRHSARGQRHRRPEAHHDAGPRHFSRRRLSG